MSAMQRPETLDVFVDGDGEEQFVGTLRIYERRGQSTTFEYATTYIADARAYAIDPALPLQTGVFSPPSHKALFNAFADSAPDRWGQNLMRRSERDRAREANSKPRTLGETDFLLGVRDGLRQGALRLFDPLTDHYLAQETDGVPALVDLPRLLAASDNIEDDTPENKEIRDLINAGGSLGGARPKAAVRLASGELAIAKFPCRDRDPWDVEAWESVESKLAQRSGIDTATHELRNIAGRNVLVVTRFDRSGSRRIGFASALTMLESSDLEIRSYLEIGEVIERHSSKPDMELLQLFRRIVFSILTSNTDDHLRNHGFLRHAGRWRLSPAYDMNPNPDNAGTQATAIDYDDTTASIELALDVARQFRLSDISAKAVVAEIVDATSTWRAVATETGINQSEIHRMEGAYDTDQRSIARRIVGRSIPVRGDRSVSATTEVPQPRTPRGTPNGGQFVSKRTGVDPVDLADGGSDN